MISGEMDTIKDILDDGEELVFKGLENFAT